ncbi:MAG: MerR family transcriptional regulator [Bacilli bacterium]
MYTVKQLATLTGVSVRTLHHYDALGLLKPHTTKVNGYRIYDDANVQTLQRILFYRELGFSLPEIQTLLSNQTHNINDRLSAQRHLLELKKKRLTHLIALIDETIKGGFQMDFKPFAMNEINEAKKQYAKETKERYGHTEAYTESQNRTARYTKEDWQTITAEQTRIYEDWAVVMRSHPPESSQSQALVRAWQEHITANYYTCTDEILAGLGLMYVADERFTKTIDAYAVGLAQYMSDAIAHYSK